MAGRVIAITGAFGVLGSALARLAVEQGHRVVLIDSAATPPDGLVAACGAPLVLGGVDLTDRASAAKALTAALETCDGLDALINVAGGFVWQTLEDGDPAGWDRLYAMNVTTAVNASRAAIPYLRLSKAGRIVNVGANGAIRAAAGMGAYAAAKAGVHRLTESLAEELKGDGVTVNAVLPSILDTPANRLDMPDADFSAWVSPRDLAAVMLFLVSPEAQAVTGALIPVTGRV